MKCKDPSLLFPFLTITPQCFTHRNLRPGKDVANHFVALLPRLLQGDMGTPSYHRPHVLSRQLGKRNQTILPSIQGSYVLRFSEASQGITSWLDQVKLESHRCYLLSACRPGRLCISPKEVVLSHSGRSTQHQKLPESAMADVGELQHPATPLAYRHSPTKQFDGAMVTVAFSHASHLSFEKGVFVLVLKSYE